MKFITYLFTAISTVLILSAAAFAQADTRSSTTWQVLSYDITVDLPASGRDIPIKAALSIKNVSGRPATSLTLRISQSATVSTVNIGGSNADFTKGEEKTGPATSLQKLSIRPSTVAAGGTMQVVVDYKMTVKDNNGLASLTPVNAQFLPMSFWYPTPTSWFYPRGGDSAPFKITISGGGETMVSTGTSSGNSFSTTKATMPFFASGSWDMVNASGVAVYTPKGSGTETAKRAGEIAALFSEARTYMAGVFGTTPDVPLRIVGLRRGAGYSNCGTVYIDESAFSRPVIDVQTAVSLSEAAARIWLGCSVTATGDGYGVITEGLTRYLATQFIESKYGKDVADVERTRGRSAYISVSKRDAPMAMVSPLDDFYYGEVTNKGAMLWRIIVKRVGAEEFVKALRSSMQNGSITLADVRMAFPEQKDLWDYFLDKQTDMNLLAGLPQLENGDTKIALRNSGGVDATVNVRATTASGKVIDTPVTVKAQSFGEVVFKTTEKIVKTEIDTDKLYPQTDYFDDVAPKETDESDPVLAVKKPFDKQAFAAAETAARDVLRWLPRSDEVRVLLARDLSAQGKNAEAEKEFQTVLQEKLPSAKSIAWANVGLAELAAKAGQNDQAKKYADAAIAIDADYGASYSARKIRSQIKATTTIDPSIKSFFADFDRAASTNKKADIDLLVLPGEIQRFAAGVAGSAQKWVTEVRQVDAVGTDQVLVEVGLTEKLLNKNEESGMAVYRLVKVGGSWKLAAVEIFEVA